MEQTQSNIVDSSEKINSMDINSTKDVKVAENKKKHSERTPTSNLVHRLKRLIISEISTSINDIFKSHGIDINVETISSRITIDGNSLNNYAISKTLVNKISKRFTEVPTLIDSTKYQVKSGLPFEMKVKQNPQDMFSMDLVMIRNKQSKGEVQLVCKYIEERPYLLKQAKFLQILEECKKKLQSS